MKTDNKYFFYGVILPALTLIYFFSGKFGLSLAFIHQSASAVWPPTGIALAAVLILGDRAWPALFLGAFFVNYTTAGNAVTSLGIAFGNTAEALINAFLIRRYAKGYHAFNRVFNVLKYVALVGLFGASISATFGVTSLCSAGFASWENYGSIWTTWWMGNVVSAIIITPFLIIWLSAPFPRLKFQQVLESLLILTLVFALGEIIFGGWIPHIKRHFPIEYLGIPLLLYSVFRFGRHGTITIAGVMSVIAIWGTSHNHGPFAVKDPNESLLLLQSFMGIITVTALILVSMVFENKRVEEILRKQE